MKVGDYVRTKDGVIAKITDIIEDFSIDCDRDVYDLDSLAMMEIPYYFKDEYIIKHSPKIKDLIQIGDYVNGYKVYEIKDNCVMVGYKCFKTPYDDSEEFLYQTIYKEDIKSIVTHEQFSQNEYRIG